MNIAKRIILLMGLLLLLSPVASAQTFVRKQVTALTNKYQNEKKVMAMVCSDGFKLKTVKAMLRKDFGQEFADAIEAFAFLYYKEASPECVSNISTDISRITQNMLQVDIEKHLKDKSTGIAYVLLSEDKKIVSDLIMVVESPSPMLIYIGGKFNAEKM